MKKFIVLGFLLFSAPLFAAICSCDAPPSCGKGAGSCYRPVAKDFLGKVFIEEGSADPHILSFSEKIESSDGIKVAWGKHNDGKPFGTYSVYFDSESTFSLYFDPFGKPGPQLIESFESPNYHSWRPHVVRVRDGRSFLLER